MPTFYAKGDTVYTSNPYTRQSGTTSGLGQTQMNRCPTGYTWNAIQNRCVANQEQQPAGLAANTAQNTYMSQNLANQQANQPLPSVQVNLGSYSPEQEYSASAVAPRPGCVMSMGDANCGMHPNNPIPVTTQGPMGVEYTWCCPSEGASHDPFNDRPTTTPTGGLPVGVTDYNSCISRCASDPRGMAQCVSDCRGLFPDNRTPTPTDPTTPTPPTDNCAQLVSSGECRANQSGEFNIPTPCIGTMQTVYCRAEGSYNYAGGPQACAIAGGEWVPANDPFRPNAGRCVFSGRGIDGNALWNYGQGATGANLNQVDPNALQVPGISTPDFLEYMNPSNYTSGLAALTQGVFGGQTLDELEAQRIAAARGDIGETFETTTEDLQDRINQMAESRGLFNSGVAQQLFAKELGDATRKRDVDINSAIANIRGERPGLLLQEQEARRQAYETWGSLDLQAKETALNSLLEGRRQDYDRMFNNGQLTLEAFNGNMDLMRLYIDTVLSSIRTEAEYNETMAKISQLMTGLGDSSTELMLGFF